MIIHCNAGELRDGIDVTAYDIYEKLTDKGLRVFFSRITLQDKLGCDYEPYIYSALRSARVMLAVTADAKNASAVWVKNEWKRFRFG